MYPLYDHEFYPWLIPQQGMCIHWYPLSISHPISYIKAPRPFRCCNRMAMDNYLDNGWIRLSWAYYSYYSIRIDYQTNSIMETPIINYYNVSILIVLYREILMTSHDQKQWKTVIYHNSLIGVKKQNRLQKCHCWTPLTDSFAGAQTGVVGDQIAADPGDGSIHEELPTKHGDLPMENVDLPMKNHGFSHEELRFHMFSMEWFVGQIWLYRKPYIVFTQK